MAKAKTSAIGRPPKYKDVAEIEAKIAAYFEWCEGTQLYDKDGNPIVDKWGKAVRVNEHPPTVTGLALALGFCTREALLGYQGKKDFAATITRAKSLIERYTEERLFDRDGVNGARFSLINNFRRWSEHPEPEQSQTDDSTVQIYMPDNERDKK